MSPDQKRLEKEIGKLMRGIDPRQPTKYIPGSLGKMAVLRKRYSLGVAASYNHGGPTFFFPGDVAGLDGDYRRRELRPTKIHVDIE